MKSSFITQIEAGSFPEMGAHIKAVSKLPDMIARVVRDAEKVKSYLEKDKIKYEVGETHAGYFKSTKKDKLSIDPMVFIELVVTPQNALHGTGALDQIEKLNSVKNITPAGQIWIQEEK